MGAASFSTSCTFTELAPNPGYKEIIIETPSMLGVGDEVTMTLAEHGISETGLLSVTGFGISATYGIILEEIPRTIVTDGVLTISSAAAVTAPQVKVFRVLGKSA